MLPFSDRIIETANKILGFLDLEAGWHLGEGVKPMNETASAALSLNFYAASVGYQKTNAFPGINGEVQVTAYDGPIYLEFTIEADGGISFIAEREREELEDVENLTLQDAASKILLYKGQPWATFESWIDNTSMWKEANISRWHSIRPTIAEYRLSKKSVLPQPAQVSADTWIGIMTNLGNPQFTGKSQITYSPKNANTFNKLAPLEMNAIIT